LDWSAFELDQRPICSFQRVGLDPRLDAVLRCDQQEVRNVESRHVGDRLDLPLHPQLFAIVQPEQVVFVGLFFPNRVDDEPTAGPKVVERLDNRLPDRRRVDDRVEFGR
jgi:hypothetical protein